MQYINGQAYMEESQAQQQPKTNGRTLKYTTAISRCKRLNGCISRNRVFTD